MTKKSRKNSVCQDDYEIAFTMYQQQHTRWNHWALFFFGSLISLFALWAQVKDFIPLWLTALMAAFISAAWVIAGQSIRATTRAWRDTIKAYENDTASDTTNNVGVYHTFEAKIKDFSRWKDFCTTLNVFGKEVWRSLTRILILIGLLSALFFLFLSYRSCSHHLTVGWEKNATVPFEDEL